MNKYLFLTLLSTFMLQGMQKPEAPNLTLTQENLELLNQANQEVIPMDTESDTSSCTSTKSAVSSSPEEKAALLAQLAALDVDKLASH